MRSIASVSKVLYLIGVVSFGSGVVLALHFAHTRPVTPNAATGQTYEIGYHGTFVYLPSGEYWLRNGFFLVGGSRL
jgi:hypothetical protein